ncbi:MAG: carboxymuconolactone decarboxylase family protein [Roseovarius sp.]|nr:carboxymuconolactone decarboxylase family protein [Roseovarius sp.]
MGARIEYRETNPQAVRALLALNEYSDRCSVDARLRRLIEVLVSRINGCSYCIAVHTHQATTLGEDRSRVEDLANWRESGRFSEMERAVFDWAERVTLVSARDAALDHRPLLSRYFSDTEIVDLTFIVLAMNAWNRLAIAFDRRQEA